MDQLLQPYVRSTAESDAQGRLDELLFLYAAPVVRRTLRQRLHFSIDRKGTNPHNPDAQDLYSFLRSLDVMRVAFEHDTTAVISTNSDLGRLLKSATAPPPKPAP